MTRPSLPYALQNVTPERVVTHTKLALVEALCARLRILVHARQRFSHTKNPIACGTFKGRGSLS